MRNLTETIEVKANQSARTFTIRKTYRTIPMSQEEFDIEEMNTENDWKNFKKY